MNTIGLSAGAEKLDATVPALLVETVSIAPRENRVRTTRHPTGAARTGILEPDSGQRSWASLLNLGDGVEPHPTRARGMTALLGSPLSRISPHIRAPADRHPNIRTMYLTSPLIPIILTPQLVSATPRRGQSRRIYNPNRLPRYHLGHSTTMRGTPPQTPTCTSLRPPMLPVSRRRRKRTLESILQLSPGHL